MRGSDSGEIETSPAGVGLLGVGVVGAAVAEALIGGRCNTTASGIHPMELVSAAVQDLAKPRPIDANLLTADLNSVIDNPGVNIVVELMGGEEPARSCIERALSSGKHVVTANKEVLAKHGEHLSALAVENGVGLLFEAAVGGGIPIIGPLSNDLLGNRVTSIRAIINGTTNYILTRMSADGDAFDAVLAEAQALGYAEADPTADVDGFDAAYKIAILARLAFKTPMPNDAIYREGIRSVAAEDILYAETLGFAIKLLAVARKEADGLLVRVHPALVPKDVPMAKVDGVLNVCEIEGDLVGPLWLQGRGAGAEATASAVLGDMIRVVRGHHASVTAADGERVKLLSMNDHVCQYYFRLVVRDAPGVLAKVAGILGERNISIDSVIQMDSDPERGVADIVLTTHPSRESEAQSAVSQITELETVVDVASLLRIESYPAAG